MEYFNNQQRNIMQLEKNKTNIMVCGDVHGAWGALNAIIQKYKPNIILQCGDFGYWPRFSNYKIDCLKNKDTDIYFCDGNHEDHWSLGMFFNSREGGISQYLKTAVEIHPRVYYQRRGSIRQLDDGRIVLFIGGAESVDKQQRIIGRDWFPEEVLFYNDFEAAMKNEKADIIISHTCPTFIKMEGEGGVSDPSRVVLTELFNYFKPKLWYFGHWHTHKIINIDGCRFEALNMIHPDGTVYPGFFNWLPEALK